MVFLFISFIICSIVFFIIFCVTCVDVDAFSFLFHIFVFSLLLSFLVSGLVSCGADIERVEVETVEIYSLQDNISADGSFFLGSGCVNDDLKYYYFVKDEYGLIYDDVFADDVTLIFDEDNPRIVTYKYRFKSDVLSAFFFYIPLGDEYNKPMKVLYLPEDSVIKDISINLQ